MVTADDRGGLRKLAGVANGIAAEEGLESLDWNCECGGRMMDPGTGILLLPIRGIRDCVGSFDIFSSKLDPIRGGFVCVFLCTQISQPSSSSNSTRDLTLLTCSPEISHQICN